jgi:hypothetical protein
MPDIDNTEQQKYIDYKNDIHNSKGIAENVIETTNEERKEYILLIIWLIIAIFVFSITTITIISEKEMNPYLMYIITAIILFLFFYIIKHIYNIYII